MSRAQGWAAIAALGAAFTFHVTISGCSVLGLVSGSIWDAIHRKGQRLIPPARVMRFYRGDAMVLILEDSTRVECVYEGSARLPAEEYERRYTEWRRSDPRAADFPMIGERVSIGERGSVTSVGTGSFRGFAHGGILLERKGRLRVVSDLERGFVTRSDGTTTGLRQVRELAVAGVLPLVTALRVRTQEGERVVPVDEVALVQAPDHPHGARNGFVIGLVADVVVVAVVASSLQSAFDNSGGCEPTYTPTLPTRPSSPASIFPGGPGGTGGPWRPSGFSRFRTQLR